MVDQGVATSISTHNDTRVEGGVFWLIAECAQGVRPERLEAVIDEELQRIAQDKVPAAELARVRSMLAAGEAQESETVTDLAEELGEFAVDADWRLAVEAVARLVAVEPDAIRSAAQRLLSRERRVVGWCLPKADSAAALAAPRPARKAARKPARKSASKRARKATSGTPARAKVKPRARARTTGKAARKKAGQRSKKA